MPVAKRSPEDGAMRYALMARSGALIWLRISRDGKDLRRVGGG